MQTLYAATFDVANDGDLDGTFERVAALTSAWAWRGDGDPPVLTSGQLEQTLITDGVGQLRWTLADQPNTSVRALDFHFEHPDTRDAQIEWDSNVQILRGGDFVSAWVRVARRGTDGVLDPAPVKANRPRLAVELATQLACTADGVPLRAVPTEARIERGGIERLVREVLVNPRRRLPALLITTPSGQSEPIVDAAAIADRLVGLAHVFVIPGYLSWRRLNDLLRELDLFVPPGGARIFWPGVGNSERIHHHRYWPRRDLENLRPELGAQLYGTLSRLAAVAIQADPAVREIHRAAFHATRRAEIDSAKTAEEQASLWEGLAELAEQERDDAKSEAESLRSANEALTIKNEELKADLDAQKEQFKSIADARPEAAMDADEVEIREVEDWEGFKDRLPELYSEAFVLTPRAIEHCGPGNPYPKPDRMWEFLEKLAFAAIDWSDADAEVGNRLSDWIGKEYGIQISLADGNLDDTEFVFEDRSLSNEPHVKVDDFKNPAECGRIYFAIDSEGKRFVVDHVGLHR